MREERYKRNQILTDAEQEMLKTASVSVFGCGGLGGYIIEELARMGIGKIYAIDFDVFSFSNLNRQIMCTENDVGKLKAEVVKDRIAKVNSNVEIISIVEKNKKDCEALCNNNYIDVISKSNLVIDALDTIKCKVKLENICEKENRVLIHGAISGWVGQVSTIFPGDRSLSNFYNGKTDTEDKLGNPAFTPAVIASIQVSEAIKVLTKKNDLVLRKKMLMIDLENNDFDILEVK